MDRNNLGGQIGGPECDYPEARVQSAALGRANIPQQERPAGVLTEIAKQIAGNNNGVREATHTVRRMTAALRGPSPQAGADCEKAPNPPSELDLLHCLVGDGNNQVAELHDAINELRSTLGY